jgi:hypothetical protein
LPKLEQENNQFIAERRKQNLEADRALCAKSKDPALCEMLATRLRGIEDKLLGVKVELKSLSDIESAIREQAQ